MQPTSGACQLTAPATRPAKASGTILLDSLLLNNDSELVSICENNLASHPNDTLYWRYLALANVDFNRTKDAEWCAYKRELICNESHDAIRFYGNVLYDCGEYSSSVSEFERLQDDLYANVNIAHEYIRALIDAGEDKKAEKYLSKMIALFGYDPGLVEGMANVLSNLGEHNRAINLLNHVSDDPHLRLTANKYKGYVFRHARLYDSAIRYYDQAVAEDSNDQWLNSELLMVLADLHDTGRLSVAIESASRIDSSNLMVHDARAYLALLKKDTATAESIYRRVVAANPKDRVALDHLELLTYDERNYPDYERQARLILKLFPDDPSAYNDLGDALEKSGKASQALEVLRQGLKINPLDTILYVSMAEAYDSLGDPESAKGYDITGLQLFPKSLDLHKQLAEIYIEIGDKEEASGEISFLKEAGYPIYATELEHEMNAPRKKAKRRL
jgi:tetratricopeptide (TPR) repeat protein